MARHENIQLIANPDSEKMSALIQNAQINILHTRHTSGMKLKLLHALFAGRFCFANKEMVSGTGLENLCEIYDSFEQLKTLIQSRMNTEWLQIDVDERKKILLENFSNDNNTKITLKEL